MKSFLIIGMGSLGHHFCHELAQLKCDIMIADKDAEKLEDMLPYVTTAKACDCTKEDVLRSFDIPSFDACFVCIGGDFEASLQVTALLKELGAKKVLSKAEKDVQAKFLKNNGADVVIFPEKDAAKNVSVQEISDNIFSCLSLAEDYVICEIMPIKEWLGKTILDIQLRSKYNLYLLATKKDARVFPMPPVDYRFVETEHIIVLGRMADIAELTAMSD